MRGRFTVLPAAVRAAMTAKKNRPETVLFLLQTRSGAPLCPAFMRQNHFFRLKYHTSSATTSTDTITTSG